MLRLQSGKLKRQAALSLGGEGTVRLSVGIED